MKEQYALEGWRYLEPGDVIRSNDRRSCGTPVSDRAVGVAVDEWDHDQFIRAHGSPTLKQKET